MGVLYFFNESANVLESYNQTVIRKIENCHKKSEFIK